MVRPVFKVYDFEVEAASEGVPYSHNHKNTFQLMSKDVLKDGSLVIYKFYNMFTCEELTTTIKEDIDNLEVGDTVEIEYTLK